MKSLIIFCVLLCTVIFYYAAAGQDKPEELVMLSPLRPLPESLDNLFPPKSETPLFLLQMHTMAASLLAIFTDGLQNDTGNVKTDFKNFKAQYLKSSKLVAEWQDHFPTAPADKFGAALESGNQGIIMGGFQNVAGICDACHRVNMARVQQKYHWDDFEEIIMTDPVSGQDIPFPQLMLFMEASLSGISNDLQQDQFENARNDMSGFAARFSTVTETCNACHDTERKYFIDENILQMIDQLQGAVDGPHVDNEAVAELQESINDESCFKCHLVHIPAANARYLELAIKFRK